MADKIQDIFEAVFGWFTQWQATEFFGDFWNSLIEAVGKVFVSAE